MRAQDGRLAGDLGGDAAWPLREVDEGAHARAWRGIDTERGRRVRAG
jgi:hypothetical protein